eukprot:m.362486 g.362486  ORF g.362486 m.362486 type:complete len:338 (+) comp20528_c0_seq1:107-1120(+)
MGERKGTNKYYPPDFDPRNAATLNAYHGRHALAERARKIDQGILIIRFEAPWNFWCTGCNKHIGRGVRWNAEKKKVGNYYTTPIYAFTMKCHMCDNKFTFETDPKNCDYRITEGARRKVETWDPADTQTIDLPDQEEKDKRARDAMYRLEHVAADEKKAKEAKPAMVQLMHFQKATMEQDYDTNAALRKRFRKQKKVMAVKQAIDQEIVQRNGLKLRLVDEHLHDVALAKATTFGPRTTHKESVKKQRHATKASAILQSGTRHKAESALSEHKRALLRDIKRGAAKERTRLRTPSSAPQGADLSKVCKQMPSQGAALSPNSHLNPDPLNLGYFSESD